MWVDTHCHLFDLSEEELQQQLANCQDNGVTTILNIATDLKTADTVIKQAKTESPISIKTAVGISAPEVKQYEQNEPWEEQLRTLLKDDTVIALGEIGIDGINDYYPPFELQLSYFRKQLEIAKEVDIPVIIHSRGVEGEALEICQEIGITKAIFHCYTGDAETAQKIAQAGYYISFSGVVTFKKSDYDSVIRAVPTDRLLFETDSPYLSPTPFRGKPNEPARVSLVGSYGAEVLKKSDKEIAEITMDNFKRIFSLE